MKKLTWYRSPYRLLFIHTILVLFFMFAWTQRWFVSPTPFDLRVVGKRSAECGFRIGQRDAVVLNRDILWDEPNQVPGCNNPATVLYHDRERGVDGQDP